MRGVELLKWVIGSRCQLGGLRILIDGGVDRREGGGSRVEKDFSISSI